MRKNWWFFEVFLSKPNLEPTEPLFGSQKPNLDPTEPQKTKRTSEPKQVRPNTSGNSLQFKEGFFSDFLKQILDFLIIWKIKKKSFKDHIKF